MLTDISTTLRFKWRIVVVPIALIFLLIIANNLLASPSNFVPGTTVTVKRGDTVKSLSVQLEDAHIVKSAKLFSFIIRVLALDTKLAPGTYTFTAPESLFHVVNNFITRDYFVLFKKITFPEGFTAVEMSERVTKVFPSISETMFLSLAKDHEGYLFPDTYLFAPGTTAEEIITKLQTTFDEKTQSLFLELPSNRTKEQIVVMASLIEKEAFGDEDRKVVAGILWKRFDSNMALQVDAPFLYILGKKSSELTHKDLALNSPYNTYLHKGLPPTPIGNPGLESLEAAIHPTLSPYWFYLHDSTGHIHYARSLKEHNQNKARYLK